MSKKKTSVTLRKEDKELLKEVSLQSNKFKGTVSQGIEQMCSIYRKEWILKYCNSVERKS